MRNIMCVIIYSFALMFPAFIFAESNGLNEEVSLNDIDSIKVYENNNIISTGRIDRRLFLEYVASGHILPDIIKTDDTIKNVLSAINDKINNAKSTQQLDYDTFEVKLKCDRMYNDRRQPMPFYWDNQDLKSDVKSCIVIYYSGDIDLLWLGDNFIDFKRNRYTIK